MYYKISPIVIIANIFHLLDVDKISKSKLIELIDIIENYTIDSIDHFVVIDKSEIENDILNNKKYFKLDETKTYIICNRQKIRELDVDVYFYYNSTIDHIIKDKAIEIINNCIKNIVI